MGLILPQMVNIRISNSTHKYYESKGYGNGRALKQGEVICVNVLDLPVGSIAMVKCKCDVCGKIFEKWYRTVAETKNKLLICGDRYCINRKTEDTCIKQYNVKSTNKLKEVQDKQHETCKKNYGVEHPAQSQIVQSKMKKTCQQKYGGNSPMSSNKVKDKVKATNKERYGVENVFQSEEHKAKIRETCSIKYGVEHAIQSEEIQRKIYDKYKSNGHTYKCSTQQAYLSKLLNGELNIPLVGYWADIILENEKIDLEYDGGAHRANCDFYHKITSEEFDLKERKREEDIYERGYKTIRIISKKDKIPSDEVILNLIDEFKNFDFKVIRINIDEGTIHKDYTEKWNYDFGELRRITKKSLEKFENNDDKSTN